MVAAFASMTEWAEERPAIRPNTKLSVFWVTGLKVLGRVGTHFFSGKKHNCMHFERPNAFQNASNYVFFGLSKGIKKIFAQKT